MAFLSQDTTQDAIQTELQKATDWVKTIFWILLIVGIIMILYMTFAHA